MHRATGAEDADAEDADAEVAAMPTEAGGEEAPEGARAGHAAPTASHESR